MGQNSLNRDCLMICTNSLKIRFSIMKTRKKEFRSKLEENYNLEKKALKKHEPFKAAFKRIAVILINGNEEKIDSEKEQQGTDLDKKEQKRLKKLLKKKKKNG